MKQCTKFLAIALLALSVAACGGDDEPTTNNGSNNTNNANSNNQNHSNNSGSNNENNTDNNVDNTGIEYNSSYELRVHSMVFDRGNPATKLNGLVEQNLDQSLEFPIVILLNFLQIDPDAGSLVLRGGAGLKTDTEEVYEWEETDGTTDRGPGTLNAPDGEFSATLPLFEFVSTFKFEDQISKVVIPIRELQIVGNLELIDDGADAELPNGKISGYITKEDGDETLISIAPGQDGIPVTSLFQEQTLNFDVATKSMVEAGTGDAWFVTGVITAKPTTIQ